MARYPGCDAIYEVAELFRQRCMVEGNSLLWHESRAWTNENLETFISTLDSVQSQKIADSEGSNKYRYKLFLESYAAAMANAPFGVQQIAVDAFVFYFLFDSYIDTSEKSSTTGELWKTIGQSVPDSKTWKLAEMAFQTHLGSVGPNYRDVYQTVRVLTEIVLVRNRLGTDMADRVEMQALIDSEVQSLKQKNTIWSTFSRHSLLHLLFPDYYERVPSEGVKQKIITAFRQEVEIPYGIDRDESLALIRNHFEAQGYEGFDFYNPDIESRWSRRATKHGASHEIINEGDNIPESNVTESDTIDFQPLIDATYLSGDSLTEIQELLKDRQQIIFEGPPGSGKTFVAEKFARWFAGDSLDDKVEAPHVETVQFHQSYGYEDFVQGIRPETNETGGLTYRVRDGIFKRLCDRAANDPTQPYVLLIDEINRGNISRIFGELLYLLEYRNRSVSLPYGAEGEKLTIPENLYIIGTMNSADRSLAQVDYALRRRFYFIRFMPVVNGRAEVLEQWLQKQTGLDEVRHERILQNFVELNREVERLLTSDMQVGHSYYMQFKIADPYSEERIWKYAVRPLLEEYFHHHKDRKVTLDALAKKFSTQNFVLDIGIKTELLDAE